MRSRQMPDRPPGKAPQARSIGLDCLLSSTGPRLPRPPLFRSRFRSAEQPRNRFPNAHRTADHPPMNDQHFEFGFGECSVSVALGGGAPASSATRAASSCSRLAERSWCFTTGATYKVGNADVLEQRQGMIDLPLQFAEPHATARQETAGGFECQPRHTPNIARRACDPNRCGEIPRSMASSAGRLPPPSSPDLASRQCRYASERSQPLVDPRPHANTTKRA
jgi:hypothetical protein